MKIMLARYCKAILQIPKRLLYNQKYQPFCQNRAWKQYDNDFYYTIHIANT
jgi:hypothetical protein